MNGVVPGLGAIVLAGGKSARMGTSKAWLEFGGELLLQRVVRLVAEAAAPVVVVAAAAEASLPPLAVPVTIAHDATPGRGPLEGIAAGLAALAGHADAAFVTTTDAPFLDPALVRRLASLRVDRGVEAVVPDVDGRVYPLTAVYAATVQSTVADLLAAGVLRASALAERTRTLRADRALLLADAALAAADPDLRSLRNVNTPAEYDAALAELAHRGGRGA